LGLGIGLSHLDHCRLYQRDLRKVAGVRSVFVVEDIFTVLLFAAATTDEVFHSSSRGSASPDRTSRSNIAIVLVGTGRTA
jgi:hypothetical protein